MVIEVLAEPYDDDDPIELYNGDGRLLIETSAEKCADAIRVPTFVLHNRMALLVEQGRFHCWDRRTFSLLAPRSRWDAHNVQAAFLAHFTAAQGRRGAFGATNEDIELVEEDQVYEWETEVAL